jgi:hypothetical protein
MWRGPLHDDTGAWLVCNTCGEQIPWRTEHHLMNTTRLMVASPRGTLTHLSMHGELTLCGRRVPEKWLQEPVTVDRTVSCASCTVAAQITAMHARHRVAEQEPATEQETPVDEALSTEDAAARYGTCPWDGLPQRPGHWQMPNHRQLLERDHVDALEEDRARAVAMVQLVSPEFAAALATHPEQLGSAPSARCATDDSHGRVVARQQVRNRTSSQLADAVRNLPAVGKPALC